MTVARVAIHSSQFPEAVRADLLESLRSRRINHKFHYDSFKQTRKWLALHEAYSPARTDPDCAAIYQESFAAAAQQLQSSRVHVIGLGCGGGQKDAALLGLLRQGGREVWYTPVDVSTAMVLVARQAALRVVPEANCFPLVCDSGDRRGLEFRSLAVPWPGQCQGWRRAPPPARAGPPVDVLRPAPQFRTGGRSYPNWPVSLTRRITCC